MAQAARWLELLAHVPGALTNQINKVVKYFDPYLQITVNEYGEEHFHRIDFFKNVEAYLSDACARRARKLKVELGKDFKKLQIGIEDNEEVTDSFGGATLWWYASKKSPQNNVINLYPAPNQTEPRYFHLFFHRRHRKLVVDSYLPHVLDKGRATILKNRQRRLFTNISQINSSKTWSHVHFEHPSTFDTLAMDPLKKEAIKADLSAFMESKDYYAKVGKPWKRGYLLYGPPGTGKSSMIAAMANFLDYDVYDLELTAVRDNSELRRLFIETTGKSIIVIEDIDCSVDLTSKRKDKKKPQDDDDDGRPKPPIQLEKDDGTKVTLSGLLNFIDGLWSACGGERIIIFTTNHLDKLDPALIRRGRMDKIIEMSYCGFEAFKILATNYLDIGEHELFGEIRQLLDETDMTPADVAENLMPMSNKRKRDPDACLAGLVDAMNMKKAKMQDAAAAKAKEEEEAEAKAAAEAREKEEADAKKIKAESKGKDKTSDSKADKASNGDINGCDK